jgi:hypothetical protein
LVSVTVIYRKILYVSEGYGMNQVKKKWVSVGIPRRFIGRIKRILGFVADESLAEYARQAIQKRLEFDEAAFEEQKMLEEEVKERIKGDSL